MNLIQTLAAFVVALVILIFVHELGHYLVARWCGVKILKFSIGFGRPLLTWHVGPDRTEWCLSAIPLGGFVRMLDERDDTQGDVPAADLPRAFSRQPLWRRSLIVLAGPVANFLLAIVLYGVLHWHGITEPAAVVDAPRTGTPAAAAQLQQGDRIIGIDGEPVRSFSDFRLKMLDAVIERQPVALQVERAGEPRLLHVETASLPEGEVERDFLRSLGLELAASRIEINKVMDDSAAARAGLMSGDRIVALGGRPIRRADDMIETIREHAGQSLAIRVERDGATLDVPVTPEQVVSDRAEDNGRQVGRIGASLVSRVAMVTVASGPLESLRLGAVQTWDMSVFSLRMLGKMVTGSLSWKNLSGPVAIATYAGESARVGWEAYVTFLALISVSLGVLNLLPIPVLDGGHLVYYGLEALWRRPLPDRFVSVTQRAGMGIIMTMMVLALFNDLTRLLGV